MPLRFIPEYNLRTLLSRIGINAMKRVLKISSLCILLILLVLPEASYAYGGPGSVISGIGAALAAVAALLATLFGFIWFPLKRLYKSMKGDKVSSEEIEEAQPNG